MILYFSQKSYGEDRMSKTLSEKDGKLLLKLARESIKEEFGQEKENLKDLENEFSNIVLEENRGTFVSLHKKGDLRGCIGNIEPVKTVFNGIMDNAKHAAFSDTRFSPMTHDELKDTSIEVSILTRPETLDYTDGDDLISKLNPGVDGVMIKKGYKSATFLPQVWKQLKSPDSFLRHLCMKAGLLPDEWQSGALSVYTYQVQLFEEDT